jgi:hypothetical protein
MAAARPQHRAPPGRVPTRWAAALCTACFFLGVFVVNRFAFAPPPPPRNPPFLLDFLLSLGLTRPNLSFSPRFVAMFVDFAGAQVVMFALRHLQVLGSSRTTRLPKQGSASL